MNKIVFIVLMLSLLISKPIEWNFEKNFALQKEEKVVAKVAIGSEMKNFSMRWTLFKKEGLVILLKYDNFIHQFILYPDYQRNTFVLKLQDNGSFEDSKMVLVFKEFKDKQAYFWIGIQGNAEFFMEQ